MQLRAKPVKLFIVVLSLLVFLLTLNAKLSLYDQPTHTNTVNSSKLWLNGQKLERTPTTLVFAVISVAVFLFRLRLHRQPWLDVQLFEARPSQLLSFHSRRFLRPPPFFA